MHGLIALYFGYAIFLVLFFRAKNRDFFGKKVAILLAVKLVILTGLYFLFFSHKVPTKEREEHFFNLITQK